MTTLPEPVRPEDLAEIAALLQAHGCTFANVFVDHQEIVIDGCAPSYEAKLYLEAMIRERLQAPVRNSVRVYPS